MCAHCRWILAFEERELNPSTFQTRVLELKIRGVELATKRARVAEEVLMLPDTTPNHSSRLRQARDAGATIAVTRGRPLTSGRILMKAGFTVHNQENCYRLSIG